MSSRKQRAFETLLARREQRGAKLRAEQGAQRAQRDAAAAELAQGEAHAHAKLDAANRYAARVDAMAAGHAPFAIGDYAACRRYRDALLDEHALASAQCERLRAALRAVVDQLAATARRIARNDAQIDVVRERVRRLARAAEAAAEDMQDEDIEEGVLARRLAAARASNETFG
ncbi:type III secretion protein HrpB7 [Burkholderia thailandensis]|uniref:Type III secretory pathway protein n=1 Tax=Burkholderia thailandensis (strain ATCC 700388 / DSM 13276 / CCUG 48851 / CIP 106301 / E264) TaxID=271848 RepID=Q2T7A9_BURTA|nr:type III secretion protein HrpB7 [Burkholderia thailandensis]ABC34524.1 putative type III secretory pathway protein [Burkholderia thailandensis E264]AHI76252.1 type III secretion protein HrpB7 [Burkholderia thailandensis 2002721723]AHI81310.1 type III secretion protein HrpB7 [Burkholderia thailandensis E444]AIP28492.1 type III secretion protein HrpB7 [Burkholderia thailandensis E264]AIS97378.1 type III secretion protein HrpB7 [Burkholderia thailandensis MSMB59]